MLRILRRRKPTAVDRLKAFEKANTAICEIRPGLDEYQIAEIGHITQMEIPEDLRQFLLFSNGAYLYDRACAIFGRHTGDPPHEVGDIGESTLWYRAHSSLAADELVFGQRSGGGVFVLSSGNRIGETGYRVWLPEEDEDEGSFPSLKEWLTAELSFWAEIQQRVPL